MRPIDIIISMATHALSVAKSAKDIPALLVVFAMISRDVEELPGDHSAFRAWIESSIHLISKTNDHRE
jgi:hypothetical protein